jgi:hypothetical protein
MSVNSYVTRLLVQGVIAENVHEFEERMQTLFAEMRAERGNAGEAIPEDLALSVFTCEALLTAIVGAQDQKTLYAAQDAARSRIKKRREG